MKNIGITGPALELLKSYLSDRKQLVKINKTHSDEMKIICGVPQGTTISPILFNIQLNDIKNLPLKSTLVCYADDTVLICSESTWEAVFKTITEDLKIIDHWLIMNNLFLNYDETIVLLHSWKTNVTHQKRFHITRGYMLCQ